MQKDDIFANYKSLYELTSKTADDHIAFYKIKKTMSTSELFNIWKNLSDQAKTLVDGGGFSKISKSLRLKLHKIGLIGTEICLDSSVTNTKLNF